MNVQLLVNSINNKLGNYKSTIDMSNPSYLRKGNDEDVATLVSDMNAGNIDALITYNANPSYTLSNADEFNTGLKNVGLKISTSLFNFLLSSILEFVPFTKMAFNFIFLVLWVYYGRNMLHMIEIYEKYLKHDKMFTDNYYLTENISE